MEHFINYNSMANYNMELLKEKDKADKLLDNIKKFEEIETVEEARKLAKELFSIDEEFKRFSIGTYDCTVISKNDSFRICVTGDRKFICYDF